MTNEILIFSHLSVGFADSSPKRRAKKNLPLTQGEVSRSDGEGKTGIRRRFTTLFDSYYEVRKIITLLVKRQNSESTALSGAFRSLRLDQRACEAYPAVSLKCGECSPVLGHSVRLTPQKSVPDRIGSSDNNPLNFWSSTTNENNSNNAYNVNFSNGNVNNNNKSNSNYVRCVR